MRIIVNGFMGKLGSAICRAAEGMGVDVAAGIDVRTPASSKPFPTYTEAEDCDMPADVIIECSVASAIDKILDYANKKRIPIVICTTGLSAEDNDKILLTAKKIPVFKSANMSIGINLLKDLIKRAADVLGELDYDIEITEKHHNQKIDAPSGTALLLADAINGESGGKFHYVNGRSSNDQKREKNEIGIHAVRGGTITGEHSVMFAGSNEVIEITHSALSKEVFAAGALNAAKFMAQSENLTAGMYDMEDLLAALSKEGTERNSI